MNNRKKYESIYKLKYFELILDNYFEYKQDKINNMMII